MKDMSHLPVYQNRKQILEALRENQVIVVESPTGSGKTTQIPVILHEAGYDEDLTIGITQPRRIATLTVCEFMKKQLEDEDGSYVGYKMRFNDTTSSNTHIKVMTDGILLMELKADPLLSNYSVILVDEAHERSLNIDFIIGMLKEVLKSRPDFKVIISSATINTKKFSAFFDSCPIISIKAKVWPVDVIYRPINTGNMDQRNQEICDIVKERSGTKGDVLIFLPGEFDIKNAVDALYKMDKEQKLIVYPLYGRLSKEEQEAVFNDTPEGKTKVVVATNIAETSITIDGITTVIDLGVAKMNFYNQKSFTSSLVPLPISKSSCEQRKGRAGRTQSGVCYRLYSEKSFKSRYTYSTEEILRTDLSEVILRMSDLGLYDWEHFDFLTKPKKDAIISAEQTLNFIGAIDKTRRLTSIGEMMVKFPLLPRQSRVVVEAIMNYPTVINEVITAISFLSAKSPFILPPGEEDAARAAQKKFNNAKYGDFVSYLTIFDQYTKLEKVKEQQDYCKKNYMDHQSMQEIVHVDEQLSDIVSEIGIPLTGGGSIHDYICCIASGLKQNICVKEFGFMYNSLAAKEIFIHPGSADFRNLPKYIVAGELVETSRLFARSVSPIAREWLNDIEPNLEQKLDKLEKESDRGKSSKRGDDRGNRRREERDERIKKAIDRKNVKTAGSVTIYGKTYILTSINKKIRVATIPYEDLSYLKQKDKRAQRRAQNTPVRIVFNNRFIQTGSKLYTVLHMADNIQNKEVLVPQGNFFSDGYEKLVDNLRYISKITPYRNDSYYFVKLNINRDGSYSFSADRDYFKALDDSLYALWQLIDDMESMDFYKEETKRAKAIYDKLLKIIDGE
ncbi:MAG: ATP-dependent RNA helicase [Sphaerochaetaceae bacterium]